MQKSSILTTATLLLLGGTAMAVAQQATQIGTFKQWNAYTHNEGGGKVCYIASQPSDTKYSAPIKQRDPAFFLVTTRPASNTRNEASTIIGYPFKAESKVIVDVDGQKFTMFTQNDGAWMEDTGQEAALITAMQGGSKMTVTGTSRRGTEIIDTYSLSGVTAALSAIGKECP